jgi:hypothetical protein
MLALVLSLTLSFSSPPDTIIKVPVSEVTYIMPCTWKCSCDWDKVHTGWTILWKGETYNVEGDRKDGKPTSELFRNPNKK